MLNDEEKDFSRKQDEPDFDDVEADDDDNRNEYTASLTAIYQQLQKSKKSQNQQPNPSTPQLPTTIPAISWADE